MCTREDALDSRNDDREKRKKDEKKVTIYDVACIRMHSVVYACIMYTVIFPRGCATAASDQQGIVCVLRTEIKALRAENNNNNKISLPLFFF